MRRIEFIWDDWNIHHIARHGFDPGEVEEVFVQFHVLRRAHQEKRLAYGQTLDGRYTLVVFVYRGSHRIYVITARDMTAAEKRFYQRRRRTR